MARKKNDTTALINVAKGELQEFDADAALAAAQAEQIEESADLQEDLGQARINVKNVLEVVGQQDFECIIIWHTRNNAFWLNDVPEEGKRPDCASADGKNGIGDNGTDDGEEAHKCATCPQSRWGSSSKGKGKACRSMRLLAVHRLTNREDSTPQVEWLQCSPTSLRSVSKHLQSFIDDKVLPLQFITKAVREGGETGVFTFSRGKEVPEADLPALLKLNREMADQHHEVVEAALANVDISEVD